ncbi:MAG: hypothetical protein M1827_002252 [Pycnora praestabilis]|nr:MAG: hypothetical protein M1827_002252 [Pycnora praestabilis]
MTATNDHSSVQDEQHVLIIGAGNTGLLIAQGLKKAGIRFSIFDRESSASAYKTCLQRDWGLTLHWSTTLLEKLLPSDLWDRRREAQNDSSIETDKTNALPIFNGKTGEHMRNMPMPNTLRVSRTKLRTLASLGIDVQYGKVLTDVELSISGKGVRAVFADGESASGSVIIGTDGVRSKVRELLVGKEKAVNDSMGLVFYNTVVQYDTPEKALTVRQKHPLYNLILHPDGINAWIATHDVPDPEKPESWKFQIMCSWMGEPDVSLDDAGRLALLKSKAERFAEPFRSAMLWIEEGTPIPQSKIATWTTIPFEDHNGRCTIAGDAAHPVPPQRGQGMNVSISDAYSFVSTMQSINEPDLHGHRKTLPEAMAVYNAELVERGAKEVDVSRSNALMVYNWETLMKSPIMTKGIAPSTATPSVAKVTAASTADAIPMKDNLPVITTVKEVDIGRKQ